MIEQVLGLFEQRGREVGAYYLRTSDGARDDLVLDLGNRLWAIEIKLMRPTWTSSTGMPT